MLNQPVPLGAITKRLIRMQKQITGRVVSAIFADYTMVGGA